MTIKITDKQQGYKVETEYGISYVPSSVCGVLFLVGTWEADETNQAEIPDYIKTLHAYIDAFEILSVERVSGYFGKYLLDNMQTSDWFFDINKLRLINHLHECRNIRLQK